MGRPNKPTYLKEIAGAYTKNPSRRNHHEPIPREGIGKCPESLPTDFSLVWDELVQCVCPGVLGNSDRLWLELTTTSLIKYRTAPNGFSAADFRNLQSCLVKLGLNPADRARLSTIPEEEQRTVEDAYFD